MLPEDLPLELTPFAFLVGKWSGQGVISYQIDQREVVGDFTQTIEFTINSDQAIAYVSQSNLIDGTPLATELGFWRLARPAESADPGPGLLPPSSQPSIKTREELERLRNSNGGFDIEVSILQSGGVSELYLGELKGARVDISTDAVLRSASAKEYSAATRMFGLVEGELLWAWDIAAFSQPLASHASARLQRVS